MPVVAYSHKAILALPDATPPRAQQEHSVLGQPGLLIVAGRRGTRTWFLRYQLDRRRRKMKLGGFPAMSLKEACDKVTVIRAQIAGGIDPMGEPRDSDDTFEKLCAHYLEAVSKGSQRLAPATIAENRRILGSRELKGLRRKRPSDITRRDIALALEPFETRDSLVMLNRVQAAISSVFGWAEMRHLTEGNPVRTMKRRFPERARERSLTMEELQTVWGDIEGRSPLVRAALRLVLLTGQRPGEIRRMRWDDVDGSTWTMPRGYRKAPRRGESSREHSVHLADLALRELERIRGRERGGFVFPSRATHAEPISRQALARPVSRLCARLEMDKWTPHDLRRTARTMWSDPLKVDPIVAEKLLGHALPPILRTYDWGKQWEDRVEALDRWAELVLKMVGDAR